MMTEEERMSRIRMRTAQIQKKDRRNRQYVIDICCVILCLGIIVYAGSSMPSLISGLSLQEIKGATTTASILGNNGALGYILMGILAFVLGICVTILMFHMKERNREDKEERKPDEF